MELEGSDNPFQLFTDHTRQLADTLEYPARIRKHVDEIGAFLEQTLGEQLGSPLIILGVYTSGFFPREYHVLLPQGIYVMRRQLWKRGQFVALEWALKFDEIAEIAISTPSSSTSNEALAEYEDLNGQSMRAKIPSDFASIPWLSKTVFDLIAPEPRAMLIHVGAKITLKRRDSEKSTRLRKVDVIKGNLVAVGPVLRPGHFDEQGFFWGPRFVLVNPAVPDWGRRLDGFLSDSVSTIGAVLDIIPLGGSLINKILGGIVADTLAARLVDTDVALPVSETFLQGRRPFFGDEYKENGVTHRWEWREGSWPHELYVLRNYWAYRCFLHFAAQEEEQAGASTDEA